MNAEAGIVTRFLRRSTAGFFLAGALMLPAADAPAPDRKVDGILDNFCLVEEAFNQEAGVVQRPVVIVVAAPISLTRFAPDYRVFLYVD